MAQLPQEKLDALEQRFVMLEDQMTAGLEPDEFVRLSKEYSELQPVVGPIRDYRKAVKDREDARDAVHVQGCGAPGNGRSSRSRS